jgi:hypothetical protein
MRKGFVGADRGNLKTQGALRKAFNREVREGNAKRAKKGVHSGHNMMDIDLRMFIRLGRGRGDALSALRQFQAES